MDSYKYIFTFLVLLLKDKYFLDIFFLHFKKVSILIPFLKKETPSNIVPCAFLQTFWHSKPEGL